MKLREKDIITLRVEGTGYAAKTDEKVRRPPWRPPRPRNAPRRAPEPRVEQALTLRPALPSRTRRHSSSALSRARWRASSRRAQLQLLAGVRRPGVRRREHALGFGRL